MALALPEASERPSHGQPTFFAGGKMFAQFRHDHHGDGKTVLIVKIGAEEVAHLVANLPRIYAKAAYFRADWAAIDLASDDADWDLIGDRLAQSWELSAPKRLLEAGGR